MECLGGYTFLVMTSVILSGSVKMRVEHGMLREVYMFCHDPFCSLPGSTFACFSVSPEHGPRSQKSQEMPKNRSPPTQANHDMWPRAGSPYISTQGLQLMVVGGVAPAAHSADHRLR